MRIIAGILAIALTSAQPAAAADSLARCFTHAELGSWTAAPDAKTIYFRVDANRYYRLDLARECWPLKWPDAMLITHIHGSGLICSALDLELKASQGHGDIPEACFTKELTQLSAAEAAALPKRLKP